jgi:hypothetical protein
VNAELINVGGGPAVRVHVTATYTDAGDEATVAWVETKTLPFLAGGQREVVPLSFNRRAVTPPGAINFEQFQVQGSYRDRHAELAGVIFDWQHGT